MSKFIHNTDLFAITDVTPLELVKVDISTIPPTWTIYTMNSGEDYASYNDLTINDSNDKLYIPCIDGIVVKFDMTNPNTREPLYIGEIEELNKIISVEDFNFVFVGNNDTTGELFKIDEAEIKKINTVFYYLKDAIEKINTFFSYIKGKIINTDFKYLKLTKKLINTDFKYLTSSFSAIESTPRYGSGFSVTIDGGDCSDVDLKSITVRWITDDKSTASFELARKHDKINYTLDNVFQQITNQNDIEIHFNDILLFIGKISNLDCSGESEKVIVNCKGDEWDKQSNTVELSLPSINEKLHLYHVLIDNIKIYNPYIDPSEENPEIYKGIKVNLGNQETERLDRGWVVSTMNKIQFDVFEPLQNWTYFWMCTIKRYEFPSKWTPTTYLDRYVGTSLGGLTSDLWEVNNIYYFRQRIYDNIISELGYYYVGTAPYKEIFPLKNGKYIPKDRYEDKENGLYLVKSKSYNYVDYVKEVVDIEYQKIQNINGTILPITSSDITLSIDALLFYNLGLSSKINIVNTTEINIYKNNNGFPLSIKEVNINSSDMKAIIYVDNKKTISELDELDNQLPTEVQLEQSPYVTNEINMKLKFKFDLNTLTEVW